MNRFTLRSALVLAAVLLLAGATTSFAQFTTPAAIPFTTALSSTNPNPVRVAGGAEWVTDIVATQVALAGAVNGVLTSGAATSTFTYQLVYSAPIANKVLSNIPTAVNCTAAGSPYAAGLTVAPAAPTPVGIQVVINNITCGVASSTISWTVSGAVLNIVITTPTLGTVTFGGTTVITVKGVRLNVASLGAVPAVSTLTNTLATYPANLVSLSTASFTVATSIVQGLSSASRLSTNTDENFYFIKVPGTKVNSAFGACTGTDVCGGDLKIRPRGGYGQCNIRAIPQGGAAGGTVIVTNDGKIDTSGTNNFGGNGGANAIGIKVVEGAPGILSTKATETAKSTGVTEVDSGTRIRFDFSGLPTQVVVGAAEQVSANPTTENENAAQPASGLTVDLYGAIYCTVGACAQFNQAIVDVKAASGGTVTFEYEVSANTGGTTGNASSVIIPFWLWRTSTPVDLSTISISVRLGPILGGSVVRFSDTAQTAVNQTVEITACTTTLFYPYVVNTLGFDTGIWILNGSDQQGTCSVRYTQTLADGTAKNTTKTTGIILSKAGVAFTASDSTLGNAGMLNGFIRATCNFEGGHGAAYVTYQAAGVAPIGSAPPGTLYLALVGDEGSGRNNR